MLQKYFHIIEQSDLNTVVDLLRGITPFPEEIISKLMDSKRISRNIKKSTYNSLKTTKK